MKKFWVLYIFVIALVVGACAPAAGRPAIPYAATQSEIIGAVTSFGPLIQPGGAYNYLSIESIGGSYVTLVGRPDNRRANPQRVWERPRQSARPHRDYGGARRRAWRGWP